MEENILFTIYEPYDMWYRRIAFDNLTKIATTINVKIEMINKYLCKDTITILYRG